MLAHRRPAPIAITASPILSYNSLSSLSSDLDSDCETPGLLNRDESSTQTASDFGSPPETPIRPITDVPSKDNEHLNGSDKKQLSALSLDDEQILQITTTLLKSDEPGAPHLIHNPSYWCKIDGGDQEDLGYEAEAEGQVVTTAGPVGYPASGHWRSGLRSRRQQTNSAKAKRSQAASWATEGAFDGDATERSSPATPLQSLVTPTPSPLSTPTATPKLSNPQVEPPTFRSVQPSTMSGLGLGLPSCMSKGDVEAEVSLVDRLPQWRERKFQGRIHSAPGPAFSPSTPVLATTPRFPSPIHQLPIQRVGSVSPLELGCPPPPMRLRPTLLDELLSPLELPESWLSTAGASSRNQAAIPVPPCRPIYPTRRSASLTALLNKKDDALNDPGSPFHSPIPPTLVSSPQLKTIGIPHNVRQKTQRRTSSVRLYAKQIHERRELLAGRLTRDLEVASNTPPLGFVPMPLSPEMPPVNQLLRWKETQERIKDLFVSDGGTGAGEL
ncbi:hypothetical protein FRB93_012959 [Tulasnella sp. JGI-2019a]|nr:hypothetical protein FRB93_012959 [Tulasnella sp. JGI-2019a]